jgi:hypothetical protein
MRFFNDPEIQEILHVRGYNLPGLNFKPEAKEPVADGIIGEQKKRRLSNVIAADVNNYYAPSGWISCNDNTVSIQ